MKKILQVHTPSRCIVLLFFLILPFTLLAQPANDNCGVATATTLTPGSTCVTTTANLFKATSAGPAGSCGGATLANTFDVWFKFTAAANFEKITLSGPGGNLTGFPNCYVEVFSGACGSLTSLVCQNAATPVSVSNLIVNNVYYVRVYNTASVAGGSAALWQFSICILNGGRYDYSKSYVNITKKATGGSVTPGDILEIRSTFVVFNSAADSIVFNDTLPHNGGVTMATTDSLCARTNEGKCFRFYGDAFGDGDGGWYKQIAGPDTAIEIHLGQGATNVARGKLRNTSHPSLFGGTCVIMATYRVQVYGAYGSKINFGGGSITFRDSTTGIFKTVNFPDDSIMIYQSPGLCPNAVAAANAVGVETNGTFGASSGSNPILTRSRGASAYVPGYIYSPFLAASPQGPQDYYYSIANNTSSKTTAVTTIKKPDPGSVPNQNRVFAVWDITGDHGGTTNGPKGNPPCDTTKPVSPTNPCGYMLVINSSYKTDTAFQYTVSSLCPNTYYEISAWVKNICSKCSCDSAGNGPGTVGYFPTGPGDSSGVVPNLAFDVNGTDYYTTGDIVHKGLAATQQGSDSMNRWTKKGFTYLTGPSQNSFTLTIRNNAPGGGGNDWAMDDITVSTCLPNMQYSPSTNPNVCRLNPLTLDDTVRSYFNNYVYYKWQRSTNGGSTWTDVTAPMGPATPTWNGTAWQYITSYTIPPSATDTSDSGDLYRLIVGTTLLNLADINCQVTDGVSIINLSVTNCGIPLKTDLLSFTGQLVADKSNLSWTTSKEDEPIVFNIERSNDGTTYSPVGSVNSHNNYTAELNSYSFIDPQPVTGKVYYRLVMVDRSGGKKYSRTIQLSKQNDQQFGLVSVINPFNYSIDFDVTSPSEARIEVMITDLYGKLLRKNSYLVHAGINALSVPNTENLPAGTYIFRIKNNDTIINRKILKKSF